MHEQFADDDENLGGFVQDIRYPMRMSKGRSVPVAEAPGMDRSERSEGQCAEHEQVKKGKEKKRKP
jgi:hypothetical protein